MAFGRRKPAEPEPAPFVDWWTIREFEISTRLHAKARLDRHKDQGELAVRVPADDSERAPLLPCVYFEPNTASHMSRRAFLDEDAPRCCCSGRNGATRPPVRSTTWCATPTVTRSA